MQNQSRKKNSRVRAIRQAVKFGTRFKRHPEELDALIDSIKNEQDVSESSIGVIRDSLIAMREEWIDIESGHMYAYDRYMLSGIGALDLILLPVIVPMGVSDTPLFLALLFLVISIVFVVTSLFFGFVKSQAGITRYGVIHGTIVFLALLTGAGAMAGMLLHVSVPIAIVFMAVAFIAFIVCTIYVLLVRVGMRYIKMQEGKSPEDPATDTSAGSEH